MQSKKLKYILSCLGVLLALVLGVHNVSGQSVDEKERALREELQKIEREIQVQQGILSTKKNEGASIERDIAILDAKIKEAQLKIKKHNLAISELGRDIVTKTGKIEELDQRIDNGNQSLSQIFRKANQLDGISLSEVILSGKTMSDFFADLQDFLVIQKALADTFTQIRDAKLENEQEKKSLESKRNLEVDTRVNVEREKKIIESSEAEKKRLLAANKLEQAGYQQSINEKAKKAAQIRAALFALRDAASIQFGQAYEYAKEAAKVTGIRPAFLLAIITQESNLGQNVGSCYLTDQVSGAGIRITSGASIANVMKPTRDVGPFLQITGELGRDWQSTRVSCPFTVGYGGAMGPAQFIPSTWMLFKGRIASGLGVSVPDPWNPEHAFMASALYLSDLGAVAGSYTGERTAACKYYSGKACSGSNTFYGNQVMAKAASIQADIDILDNN